MRLKNILCIFALLCAVVQGAWAQASWDEVYAMTGTTSANWTALTDGSTTGKTLGTANATTYYYADANLSFTNSMAGGSGLTILGTVYLYVPQGVTVTCTGANANDATGGGAGIELASGNTLNLLGSGSVNATGGNAANGGNGGYGEDAYVIYDNTILGGSGGRGGNGGGGAGAGIGTRGANGGSGGSGGQRTGSTGQETTQFGVDGNAGSGGSTAGPMGTLYKTNDITVNATGGSAGSNGTGGSRGKTASQHPGSNVYMASGGGGGGAGGFGGAATGIGTGGPGGGGGGGGAAGNVAWVLYSGTDNGYYHAGAFGGNGGTNADGSTAPNGADVELTNPKYADIQAGGLRDDASDYKDDDGWEDGNGRHDGGSGGAAGSASTSESAVTVTMELPDQNEWDMACRMTNTSRSDWTALPLGGSKGITIGAAGKATYYFATGDRTFTNSTAGGSGMTIQGTVYLFISSGQTIACTGAHARGAIGGGAGIEVTAGNTLYLIGSGTLNATGGNAANGEDGGKGGDSGWNDDNMWSGAGGKGGDGGGGAGAGIGSRGGNGGAGGAGATATFSNWEQPKGKSGSDGNSGSTAGPVGNVYVYQSSGLTLNAAGGVAATAGGNGGAAGKCALDDDLTYNYSVAGGGGGGGGGFGGTASNIGTGGPGGGGGGGGASSEQRSANSGYSVVKSPGGSAGQNTDGTWASPGAESILNWNAISSGNVTTNSTWSNNDSDVGRRAGSGGSGAGCGNAATGGSAIPLTFDWTTQEDDWGLICLQTGTTREDWVQLTDGATKGRTLGAAGTTTYYYTMMDRTFTNITPGGSGLTIQGTVYLYIPARLQITCTGADASGATGAGAGIELTEGNTLYLIGSGKLVATGGNAANGGNGTNGGDATTEEYNSWLRTGDGGNGGDGGGGAGAGIGTRGGNGGAGGAGGAGIYEVPSEFDGSFDETTGNVGSNGQNGSSATDMGTLYIYDGSQALTPQTNIQGGSKGTSGNGGNSGNYSKTTESTSYVVEFCAISGGGGGAGGGFGGAASNIGTGGPGGGGGGGGSSGTVSSNSNWAEAQEYYDAGALGGNPGMNGDGTAAGSGASTQFSSIYTGSLTNAGWRDGIDHRAAGGEGGGCGSATTPGSAIPVEMIGISLADNADNSTTISDNIGNLVNVTLVGRTLYKDGAWNTLCLPFDVTLAGSALNGATARPLTAASISGTTLNLTFGDAVNTLEAGTPYIIKWDGDGTSNIENPVFEGVTIEATKHDYDTNKESVTTDERVRFVGTYKSTAFDAEDQSILLMGGSNTLYYPQSGASIGAQRAYFKIGSGDAEAPAFIASFNIDFGDGETTGIISVHDSGFTVNGSDAWYSLDGRKLDGKPTQRGVYINNGKKVVIK